LKPNLDHPESLLRPLRRLREDVERLRAGDTGGDPALPRRILRAAEAVLRRMLRADARAPLEMRLRSLDVDELDIEEVLGELRRLDAVRLETAAAHHRLARQVAHDESPPAALILELLERLEADARALAGAGEGVIELGQPAAETAAEPMAGVAGPRDRLAITRRLALQRALIGALAFLVLVTVLWFASRDRRGEVGEGVALFRSGELEAAAARFESRIARDPGDVTARLYLARIHRRQGRHDAALEQLREAARRAPEDAAVHRELGLLFLDAGQPDAAVRRFREAVRLDGDSEAGWIGLVRALRAAGDHAAAEQAIRDAPPEVRALLPPTSPAP
jgi:tetratricopeptide (TPR) repeat protein